MSAYVVLNPNSVLSHPAAVYHRRTKKGPTESIEGITHYGHLNLKIPSRACLSGTTMYVIDDQFHPILSSDVQIVANDDYFTCTLLYSNLN